MPNTETLENKIVSLAASLEHVKNHDLSLSELMAEFSKAVQVYQSLHQDLSASSFEVVKMECELSDNLVECKFDWKSV